MGLAAEIVGRLKQVLKAKSLTYKDLSLGVDVPESTLKRWFSSRHFTIENLEGICKFLEVDLQDLSVGDGTPKKVRFLTEDQELILSTDEVLFVVFYLVISGLDINLIEKHFNFSRKDITKALLQLDKLGLIEVHTDDRIVPLVHQGIWWSPTGVLNQKYYNEMMADYVSTRFQGENQHCWFLAGNLSVASLQTIRKKIEKMTSEFQDLFDLDEHLPTTETTNVTLFTGLRPWIFPVLKKYRRTKSAAS